jgi:hypothetical protein
MGEQLAVEDGSGHKQSCAGLWREAAARRDMADVNHVGRWIVAWH